MNGRCWHCKASDHDTAGCPGHYRGGAVDGSYEEFKVREPVPERTWIERLCVVYDARIAAVGSAEKVCADCTGLSIFPKLRHLRWMLAEIPKLPEDKANRWLGFVQGVLYDLDFFTINELRAQVEGAKR